MTRHIMDLKWTWTTPAYPSHGRGAAYWFPSFRTTIPVCNTSAPFNHSTEKICNMICQKIYITNNLSYRLCLIICQRNHLSHPSSTSTCLSNTYLPIWQRIGTIDKRFDKYFRLNKGLSPFDIQFGTDYNTENAVWHTIWQ